MLKTKAQIIIPKVVDYNVPERVIKIKGTREQIEKVKKEITIIANCCFYGLPPAALLSDQQFPVPFLSSYRFFIPFIL